MRWIFKFLAGPVIISGFCTECLADRRVALVVGNSAYKYAPELVNPENDAADMSEALKGLGFEVVYGKNLEKAGMEGKIREFSGLLQGASVGIFFYAGHGLQVNGNNYLVPTDAQLSTIAALEFEMVRLDSLQRLMEASTKTNIIFLDACRNNPLSRNLARAMGSRAAGIGRGLAAAESGVGTLISYSTQPGNVALDGTGRNSPYAGPLVRWIKEPGQDVLSVLTNVRNEVLQATGEAQVPWENHALRSRFYFHSSESEAAPEGQVSPVRTPPPERSGAETQRDFTDRIINFVEWEFLQDREKYDTKVDYYDKGIVDRDFIARDRRAYAEKWPTRRYTLVPGSVQIQKKNNSEFIVTFEFKYQISKSSMRKTGAGRGRLGIRTENDDIIVTSTKTILSAP